MANPDTPEWVREKWASLAALGGRNRNKNKLKTEFTDKFLSETSGFTDAYRQTHASDVFQKKEGRKGKWVLKSAAIHSHGGTEGGGLKAVEDAVRAGVYEEKTEVKKGVLIVKIKVCNDFDEDVQQQEFGQKARAGKKTTTKPKSDLAKHTQQNKTQKRSDLVKEKEVRSGKQKRLELATHCRPMSSRMLWGR